MKRNSLLAMAAILGAAVVNCLTGAQAAEFKLPDANATPQELVRAALRSELDGASHVRKTLLDRALELDRNYAPARWHSGFVRYEDEWLSLDEVAKRAAGDTKLTEYRKRRDDLIDRAEDHREMARWCKKHGLTEEARVHWAKVLEFDSADRNALAALDLQLYEGQLLTKKQIVEAKKRAGERKQALLRWKPQVMKWRKGIEAGSGKEYEDAREALAQLDDADALEALEQAFADNGTGLKSERLNLALIETVGRMPGADATAVLVRRSLLAGSSGVAMAAADALAKRPKYAYVPQLVANLPNQLKSQFHVTALPDGGVVHEHELQLETPQGTMVLNLQSTVQPADATAAARVTPVALTNEQLKANAIEARVAAAQQVNDGRRERINQVLKRATGFDNGEDAELWTTVYAEYYGWSRPERSAVVRRQNVAEQQVFYTLPRVEREQRDEPAGLPSYTPPPLPDAPAQPPASNIAINTTIGTLAAFSGECFAAETPIETFEGARPIELVQAGDRVLSQNVETGELEYKTVLRRTLRRGADLMELTLGMETLVVTPGHPFFVVGKGWQVAKHLQAGDRLATANGIVAVEKIQSCASREVYNLVVSDFSTFFVGNRRLLVHDDLPIRETTALLPGLTIADIK